MNTKNKRYFRTGIILLAIFLVIGIQSDAQAVSEKMQTSQELQQTLSALMEQLGKPAATVTPTPQTSGTISQEDLMMRLLEMLDSSKSEESNKQSETTGAFTTEQLQQLMIMLNTSGSQTQQQPAPVQAPIVEPTPVPTEAAPVECIMAKVRINQTNTCSVADLDPEFSINVVWQPRLATHIGGIAASGVFVEIRLEITNLTNEPWDGLRASSFSLVEDFIDLEGRVSYSVHESATARLSKSYEMNQLRDLIMPGQAVTYFLVFDVAKELEADQSLLFRAVDRSGQKSLMALKMPLPRYTW